MSWYLTEIFQLKKQNKTRKRNQQSFRKIKIGHWGFRSAAVKCSVLCWGICDPVPHPPDDYSLRPLGHSVSQMTQSHSSHMYAHTHAEDSQLQIAAHSSPPALPLFPSSTSLHFPYFCTLILSPFSSLTFSSALCAPVSHPPFVSIHHPPYFFPRGCTQSHSSNILSSSCSFLL